MTDLRTQLRTYYESTTEPVDIENIAVDPGEVVVGPMPEAARRRSAMTATKPPRPQTPWRSYRVVAATLISVVVLITAVVVITNDSGNDAATSRTPQELLGELTDAYDAKDFDRAVNLFDEQATLIRYPSTARAVGHDEIRAAFDAGEGNFAPGGRLEITDIEVSGNVVTFTHRRTDVANCATAPGHRMVLSEGKILEWEWPMTSAVC